LKVDSLNVIYFTSTNTAPKEDKLNRAQELHMHKQRKKAHFRELTGKSKKNASRNDFKRREIGSCFT